jgi:hypothetical protein
MMLQGLPCRLNWPATDVLLHIKAPCDGPNPCFLQVDKLPDGSFRAAFGTLFETVEVARTTDLEGLLRCTWRAMQSAHDPRRCAGNRIPAQCRNRAWIAALQAMHNDLKMGRARSTIPTTGVAADGEAFISPVGRADCPLPKTPTPKLPREPV